MTMPRDIFGKADRRACADTCARDAVPATFAVRWPSAAFDPTGMLLERRASA